MSRLPTSDNMSEFNGALTPADPSATAPLMTGAEDGGVDGFGEPEVWGSAGGQDGNKLLGQSTILIVVIAVIAAGSLYAMRLTQGDLTSDQATKQVEAKIENYLTKLTKPGAMDPNDPLNAENIKMTVQDTDEIVAIFEDNMTERQVPVEYVKKNPFALTLVRSDNTDIDPNALGREQAKRLKQLNSELSRLELQTVMDGRVYIAVINGEFYKEGDTIGSFTVASISPDSQSVDLAAGESTFTITMD